MRLTLGRRKEHGRWVVAHEHHSFPYTADTRGSAELRRFLHRYVDGPTTYSSEWDRYDVSTAGPLAWLLAEGTETATSGDHVERHRYRMTMVLGRHRDHWLVRQVHGSSPH